MEIRYAKAVIKTIAACDKATKTRLREGIEGLMKKPPQGDIKPLQGYSDGRMRLRIGGYRIIFRFTQEKRIEILHIMDIGTRGDIYKRG